MGYLVSLLQSEEGQKRADKIFGGQYNILNAKDPELLNRYLNDFSPKLVLLGTGTDETLRQQYIKTIRQKLEAGAGVVIIAEQTIADIMVIEGELFYKGVPVRDNAFKKDGLEVITKEELDFNKDIAVKAAQVVHSLKSPLSVVGYCAKKLIKEDPSDVLGLKLLEASKKLESITKQLLSINEPVSLELVDINKVLEDEVKFFKAVGEFDANFLIDIQLQAGLQVFANSSHLGHVFSNILQNAIDILVDEKHREIKISGYIENGWVRISIEDSGRGIPLEHEPKIFEPLFTTKQFLDGSNKIDGSGLGLSYSRQIVNSYGGSLDVQSSASLGGARFIVSLPAR